MAPGRGEAVVARARVLRAGRTLTTCAGVVLAIEGGREQVVITMLATMMTVVNRPGLAD